MLNSQHITNQQQSASHSHVAVIHCRCVSGTKLVHDRVATRKAQFPVNHNTHNLTHDFRRRSQSKLPTINTKCKLTASSKPWNERWTIHLCVAMLTGSRLTDVYNFTIYITEITLMMRSVTVWGNDRVITVLLSLRKETVLKLAATFQDIRYQAMSKYCCEVDISSISCMYTVLTDLLDSLTHTHIYTKNTQTCSCNDDWRRMRRLLKFNNSMPAGLQQCRCHECMMLQPN